MKISSVTNIENSNPFFLRLRQAFLFSLPRLPDARFMAIIVAVVICLYGYELFNFTLSIDEELHSFSSSSWLGWVLQGRWGMALISTILPPISSIPFMSTLIFMLGLVISALNFANLFQFDYNKSITFCLIYIAFPIWPHIAEFNTLSFGVGIGLVAISMGIRLVMEKSLVSIGLAIVLLSFSIAVYQTFFIFIIIGFLLVILVDSNDSATAVRRSDIIMKYFFVLLASSALYFFIQKIFYSIFGIESSGYVEKLFKVQEFSTAFLLSVEKSLLKSIDIILGFDQLYLGYGFFIQFIPLAGLLIFIYQCFNSSKVHYKIFTLFILFCVIVLPVFVSIADLPSRGLIYIPLVFGVFGTFTVSSFTSPIVQKSILTVFLVLSIYISNQLFYWDFLARLQDYETATSFSQRFDDLRTSDNPIPFTIIGALQPQLPVRKVEVFGASIFEWDGGTVNRANAYMKLIGVRNILPVDIGAISLNQLERISKMPIWPAKGSVDWVDDVVVIKLEQLNIQQKTIWCSVNKGLPQFCL